MSARNKHVDDSFKASAMSDYLRDNTEEYKDLLKKLICQGLIKLMEGDVKIQVRESDKDIVESVLEEAGQMYKDLMKD